MIVTVCRKPLSESTVVLSVCATGCGSLNIDACRISAGTDNLNGGAYAEVATPRAGLDLWSGDRKGDTQVFRRGKEFAGDFVKPAGGRWPANLILMHGEGCRQDGTKSVGGSPKPYIAATQTGGFGGSVGTPKGQVSVHYGDSNGTESIASWVCQPDCPVAELDNNTQISFSSGGRNRNNSSVSIIYGGGKGLGQGITNEEARGDPGFGDTSTASRYFKQIQQNTKPCPE